MFKFAEENTEEPTVSGGGQDYSSHLSFSYCSTLSLPGSLCVVVVAEVGAVWGHLLGVLPLAGISPLISTDDSSCGYRCAGLAQLVGAAKTGSYVVAS